MNPNEITLTKFYRAFAELDADTMTACYAEDASFEDPAFSLKERSQIGGMWHMLCDATRQSRGDWELDFNAIEADEYAGKAHWEARYRFTATDRKVHNIIDANFTFTPSGLIASHRDSFDFWRWSRQALGFGGLILGWAPYFRKQVRAQTLAALTRYLAKNS